MSAPGNNKPQLVITCNLLLDTEQEVIRGRTGTLKWRLLPYCIHLVQKQNLPQKRQHNGFARRVPAAALNRHVRHVPTSAQTAYRYYAHA